MIFDKKVPFLLHTLIIILSNEFKKSKLTTYKVFTVYIKRDIMKMLLNFGFLNS